MHKTCIRVHFTHVRFYRKVRRCSRHSWCYVNKIVKEVQVTVEINRAIKFKRDKAPITSVLRLTLHRFAMAGEQTIADRVTTKDIEQDSCLVGCDTV